MRTVSLTAYTFDELSLSAQIEAIQKILAITPKPILHLMHSASSPCVLDRLTMHTALADVLKTGQYEFAENGDLI